MDEASGLCVGCLRTLDEIALWSALDDADKRMVLQQAESRRLAGTLPPPAAASGG